MSSMRIPKLYYVQSILVMFVKKPPPNSTHTGVIYLQIMMTKYLFIRRRIIDISVSCLCERSQKLLAAEFMLPT